MDYIEKARLERAFKEGESAFLLGMSREECPYKVSKRGAGDQWLKGWWQGMDKGTSPNPKRAKPQRFTTTWGQPRGPEGYQPTVIEALARHIVTNILSRRIQTAVQTSLKEMFG